MSAKPWFSVSNSASGVEVLIYDVITSEGGVSALDLVKALAPHKGKRVNVRINSPGGSVDQGVAIYNALKSHQGGCNTQVDSMAASIASYIAQAGIVRSICENARMMIHNPAGGCMGGASDMRQTADVLESYGDTIAQGYAARSGKSVAEIKAAMDAETWLTAAQCLDFGLADKVIADSGITNSFDLTQFRNAPRIEPQTETQHTMPTASIEEVTASLLTITSERDTLTSQVSAKALEITNLQTAANAAALEIVTLKADKLAATNSVASLTAELAPLKISDAAKTLEITALKAEVNDYETNPEKKSFQLAAKIVARVGVDAIKLTAKGEKKSEPMARAEFDKLNHAEREAFFRTGGKLSA